ncbi:DUF1491 family protein [Phaeovulum vinaykumarii]|uniref:GTP-binding protein Era n=1 Tax=Phaeovulum vinaykumarii TaxID=407234 RepID=A0A1N7KDT1_9RHOB|nr:DUF1491 family protein [Phaeovulum vinaykumarii]SIS59733.1 hypothetical protein SAMN05421795_101855 [Phaeovulum vinaykumarii]SOB94208.1 hypothetical protein SAMN05878426_101851 [Phaeovulum vinaykumarii]
MATEPRLAAGLWVAAYLARLQAAAIPAYVTARGDDTAGAVMVKCARLDGTAQLHERQYDPFADTRAWVCIADAPEAEIDARIARSRARDPDLWVLEIESREGRTLLDEPGLSG